MGQVNPMGLTSEPDGSVNPMGQWSKDHASPNGMMGHRVSIHGQAGSVARDSLGGVPGPPGPGGAVSGVVTREPQNLVQLKSH